MAKHTTICMKNYCKVKIKNIPTIKNIFLLVSVVTLIFSSCKKDVNSLVVDFIKPDSKFDSNFESVGLEAYTCPMDSLPTHLQSLYILGAINDPVFGKSNAQLLTSFSIPAAAASFSLGQNATVDSVVLQLRIGNDSTFVGNLNEIHTLKVYELDEKLSYDSIYYSNRNYKKLPNEIGSVDLPIAPKDSIPGTYINSSVKVPPSIRIKLNDAFKQKIQNQNTFNASDFYDLFKGFAVVDESNFSSGKGGFWYLNLNSNFTNFIVYYKNDTNRLRAEFPILIGNARYNKYENNNTFLTQPKTKRISASQKRDTCYLQALAGTKVRIFIPDSILRRLTANPQLAIQKAEIVVKTLDGFSTDIFKIPNQLSLLSTDSLNRSILTIDTYSESFIYLGGGVNNGEYRFNIARELNYILRNLKEKNINLHYGLSIIVPNSSSGSVFQTSARRIVLDSKNFKLNLNYSVIK